MPRRFIPRGILALGLGLGLLLPSAAASADGLSPANPLRRADGGTALTTLTSNAVIGTDASGNITQFALSNNQCVVSNGTDPTAATCPTGLVWANKKLGADVVPASLAYTGILSQTGLDSSRTYLAVAFVSVTCGCDVDVDLSDFTSATTGVHYGATSCATAAGNPGRTCSVSAIFSGVTQILLNGQGAATSWRAKASTGIYNIPNATQLTVWQIA